MDNVRMKGNAITKYLPVWLIVVLALTVSHASDPGQPLNCSDWVFLEPGLSCTMYSSIGELQDDSLFLNRGTNLMTDNEGSVYAVRMWWDHEPGNQETATGQRRLVRVVGGSEQVVAYLSDRTVPAQGTLDMARPVRGTASFTGGYRTDTVHVTSVATFVPTEGKFLIPIRDYCERWTNKYPPYPGGWWIASIEGFTTLMEVMQSYEFDGTAIGFRVPYMPEGFEGSDYYDTYCGDLATVGDWSSSTGLKVGYPVSPPLVGDYLTIDDAVPTPSTGQGYWYITAVNYLGQKRHGRGPNSGLLSGRDPSLFPVCTVGISNGPGGTP